jgi:aminopeptidase N
MKSSFILPESKRHYPRDRAFHVEHLKVEVSLDFQGRSVSGVSTLTFVPFRTGLPFIKLDSQEMAIKSVSVDRESARFDHDNRWLTVYPNKPLELSRHEIAVEYSTKPRRGVYFIGSDSFFQKKQEAWSHSEAEESSYWYPCYDYPNDKSSSELLVTVPQGFTVVSNGLLVDSKVGAGKAMFHWLEKVPHSSYLNSFAAGCYGCVEEEVDGIKVYSYFQEARREDAMRLFKHTANVLRKLEEITGVRYPFEKLAQVAVQDFTYGGMEHISAITYADYYFPDERSEEDFAVSYSRPQSQASTIIAHEVGHQWFGDLVTLKDWSDTWINEGFAEYCEVLYKERTEGRDEAWWHLNLLRNEYFQDDEKRYRRPIVTKDYVYPDDLFDTVSYEKAASMIHQLRYLLGDKFFFEGLTKFLTSFSGGNADSHELMDIFEDLSGLSLEKYFEQFFLKGGHPEFDVEYNWDPQTSQASLRVRQLQKTDDLTPVFALPCEIAFYTKAGRQVNRVELSGPDHTFHYRLDSEPIVVEFDPSDWLLKRLNFLKSVRLLRSQLTTSTDAASRAQAAEQLASYASEDISELLESAARNDAFWGVRVKAVESLGKLGSESALHALLQLKSVSNRYVRRAVARALGEFKDPKAIDALRVLLFNDASPYIQCESALSIGKAGYESAPALLTEAMKISSPNDTLAEACLEAMGYLKDSASRKIILEHMKYGIPERARIGALKALEHLGSLTEEEVKVLKDILLKDKQVRVRIAVLNATLSEIKDQRLKETLAQASAIDPDNRVRRRALELYHVLSREIPTVARLNDLETKVRSITEDERKLEDKVDRLKKLEEMGTRKP